MRVGIENVAGVADGRFAEHAAVEHGVHGHLHVRQPIERIEDAEQIHARGGRLAHELLDHVVRIVRVAQGVRGPQQHLEQDVRDPLAQIGQSLPGTFLEEPHGRVERRPAPHLDGEQLRAGARVGVGDGQHVVGAHASRQQRLMGVAERGVGQQQLILLSDPLAELFGPHVQKLLAVAGRDRLLVVEHGPRGGIAANLGRRVLDQGVPVDDDFRQVRQQLGGAVLARHEVEQFRRFIDELGGEAPLDELGVGDQVDQERNIGLHTADAKFRESALHPPRGVRKRGPQAVTLTSSES